MSKKREGYGFNPQPDGPQEGFQNRDVISSVVSKLMGDRGDLGRSGREEATETEGVWPRVGSGGMALRCWMP